MAQASTDTLDFDRAMNDFKRMFPSLDTSVIEQVLRNNHGAVSDTIDELLALSIDDHPHDDVDTRSNNRLSPTRSNDRNHRQYRTPNGPIRDIPRPNGVSRDLLENDDATSVVLESPDAYHSRQYHPSPGTHDGRRSDIGLRGPSSTSVDSGKRRRSVDVPTDALDGIYDEIERSNRQQRHRTRSHTAHLGIFSSSSAPHRERKNVQRRATYHYPDIRTETKNLQHLMLENNVRRQTTDDPEMLRYLDDEQFAIMLQNREFMRRLKRSPDFMSILDRESPRKTHHKKQQHQHEERIPVPDGPIVVAPTSHKLKTKWKPFQRVPDGPTLNATKTFSDYPLADAPNFGRISPDSRPPAQQLDVNEGAVGGVDAFPYTKQLNSGGEFDDDEAFVSRLRNMGKYSKEKFALMASHFSRKGPSSSRMQFDNANYSSLQSQPYD